MTQMKSFAGNSKANKCVSFNRKDYNQKCAYLLKSQSRHRNSNRKTIKQTGKE